MSIHKSLKLKDTLARQRSVLSRWERIEKLREAGRWSDGDPVVGLPKVRTKFKTRSRKTAKRETAEAAKAEVPAAAPKAEKSGKPGKK
jgi:small basic protein (TIGR04137 family)